MAGTIAVHLHSRRSILRLHVQVESEHLQGGARGFCSAIKNIPQTKESKEKKASSQPVVAQEKSKGGMKVEALKKVFVISLKEPKKDKCDNTLREECSRCKGEQGMHLCYRCESGFQLCCLSPILTAASLGELLCSQCAQPSYVHGVKCMATMKRLDRLKEVYVSIRKAGDYCTTSPFVVEADRHIKNMTIMAEYTGEVDYISRRQYDSWNSIMGLPFSDDSSKELVICPDERGNVARFVSGINNHLP